MLALVRYGIPAAFIVAGTLVLALTGDAVSSAGFTGAGLAILLLNGLYRIGAEGDRERDREEEARAYFSEHGRWPDEEPSRSEREWSLPPNIATPESERAELERRRRERDPHRHA